MGSEMCIRDSHISVPVSVPILAIFSISVLVPVLVLFFLFFLNSVLVPVLVLVPVPVHLRNRLFGNFVMNIEFLHFGSCSCSVLRIKICFGSCSGSVLIFHNFQKYRFWFSTGSKNSEKNWFRYRFLWSFSVPVLSPGCTQCFAASRKLQPKAESQPYFHVKS